MAQTRSKSARTETTVPNPITGTGASRSSVAPSPFCPTAPRPQHTTSPDARTAHAWSRPTDTWRASVTPATATADRAQGSLPQVSGTGPPVPSCPWLPRPQQTTVPPRRRAQLPDSPDDTAVASSTPGTSKGIESAASGSSDTNGTAPQHTTLPDCRTAHVWRDAADRSTASVRPGTRTAVADAVVFPSPSWPRSSSPQHATSPVWNRAHTCVSPTTSCAAPFSVMIGVARSSARASVPRCTCPQQRTWPSPRSAHAVSAAAAIWMTSSGRRSSSAPLPPQAASGSSATSSSRERPPVRGRSPTT